MSRRKKISGGQAIVMVTVALMAMCGMMGLAVDLGWSFFVQKQAQAAADGAALGAAQEAYARKNGLMSGLTCGASGAAAVYCAAAITPCSDSSIQGTQSNLYNGCLYAANNGFTDDASKSQKVTIQANLGTTPPPSIPTPPGPPTNLAYWVTVRTAQTIPQLFSSVLGNTTGTISAVATAGIPLELVPFSFIGLNHAGDSTIDPSGNKINTGMNLNLSGGDDSEGVDCPSSGGEDANLCAPNGTLLASTCNGTSSVPGCGSGGGGRGGGGNNFAGSADVWANASLGGANQIQGGGKATGEWTPQWTNGGGGAQFQDPTQGLPQPPLANPSLGRCAVTNGIIPAGTWGPFQYYAASSGSSHTPTGAPLTITSGSVNFTGTGLCNGPGMTLTQAGSNNSSFPTAVFYGGLSIAGSDGGGGGFGGGGGGSPTVDFGPGQYIMAGTHTGPSSTGNVFSVDRATVTNTTAGPGTLGTMFIFTDGTYATAGGGAALTPPAGMPTLYQGSVSLTGDSITLNGISKNAPGLSDYTNILFWQDRRNSTVTYDATGHVTSPNAPPAANHVTNTSPQMILQTTPSEEDGTLSLGGVLYQPRGAWLGIKPGGEEDEEGTTNLPLQVITGAIVRACSGDEDEGGCGEDDEEGGSANLVLLPTTNPLLRYTVALIQ